MEIPSHMRIEPPLNQPTLDLAAATDSEDEDDVAIAAVTSETVPCVDQALSSFKSWYEDDRNLSPDQKIPYLVMMMTTVDETFRWDVSPYTLYTLQKKKKSLKPSKEMYKRELVRRDPLKTKGAPSNKKIEELLYLLRTTLALQDPADIIFVKKEVQDWTIHLLNFENQEAPTTTRSVSRKIDRMRFVECMALDTVKPYYLKVNEVMTRYEMDGRNSDNVEPDFYDRVSEEFNKTDFVPFS
jgi:hypothetical protein